MSKEYLGDSVYIEWDGNGFQLTTENNSVWDPSNTIYLEPHVMLAFQRYVQRTLEIAKAEADAVKETPP